MSSAPPGVELDLPTLVLRGRVVDNDGFARSGVAVSLVSTWLDEEAWSSDRLWGSHVRSETVSGPDGAFALAFVAGGAAALVAGAPEEPLAVHTIPLELQQMHPPERRVTLVVPHRPGALVVRVKDADGFLAAGVAVTVERSIPWRASPFSSRAFIPPRVVTDAHGEARFADVAPGPAALRFEVPEGVGPGGFDSVEIAPAGETLVEVALPVAEEVHGRVVDAESGEGLAGARVSLRNAPRHCVETGSNGWFQMLMPAGTAELLIRADGLCEQTVSWELRAGARHQLLGPVRLARLGGVRVRCVTADGDPVPNVTLRGRIRRTTITNRSWISLDAPVVTSCRTDRDGGGKLVVGVQSGGELTLEFWHRGLVVTTRTLPSLAPGERLDIGDVELP